MKVPQMPPSLHDYLETIEDKDERHKYLIKIYTSRFKPVDEKGRYAHWDKLQYRPLPEGNKDPLEYWHKIKFARMAGKKNTVFSDKNGDPFTYVEFDKLNELKDWILENAAGAMNAPAEIKNNSTKSTYLISSIIEESISSSKMEGASTTRRVAKDMLRSGREPKDNSEQMIFNNYNAMMFIRRLTEDKGIKLTPSIVMRLHKIVTEGTLSGPDEGKDGELRATDDNIIVCDPLTDNILHVPPKSELLEERLNLICDFVNGKTDAENTYIPPIIRATITHFMIGYDHPFVEGNGRTARALFYWVLMTNNYWLMEYVSISAVIKRAQKDYLLAYIHSETDDNDLTYFIFQQLEVVKEAIQDFHQHVKNMVRKDRNVLAMFKNSNIRRELNPRQTALMRNALKNPGNSYTIQSHMNSHMCSKEISRRDLLKLSDSLGLIEKYKNGRTLIFISPSDLSERIKN